MEDITKYSTTREELYNAPVPSATLSYSPVSNQQLMEAIEEQLYKHDIGILSTQFKAANPNRMIGFYNLNRQNSDMNMMLGFGNSYDKSAPIKLAAGSTIFICSNGCVSGEFMFKRKHTGSVFSEMMQFVSETVEQMDTNFNKMETDFKRLKEVEVSKRAVSELLGRLFIEENILDTAQLNIVKNELKNPTYVEFKDLTGYNVLMHITHALKTAHPNNAIKQLVRTHEFITSNLLKEIPITYEHAIIE